MKKSTIIAKYLVSAGHISQIQDAEMIAERFINEQFPQLDFNSWNTPVDVEQSEQFLNTLNFSSPVQLEKLVEQLQSY